MGVGDVFGLLIAMGGLIGIVATLGHAYRRRLEHKERIAELRSGAGSTPGPSESEATIKRLEHRIRVLERIATDKTNSLAAQIEDLREPAN